MPTPSPIFLSYTGIDRDFALRFAAALKNAGVPVWMDRFELQPGCDWRRELEKVLAGAGGMICVLSPDYVSSAYCLVELASIDRYNAKHPAAPKPLFPAVLRPVPDDKQPLEVRRLQYVHFYDKDRDWRDDNLFDERLRQLLAALKATSDGGLVGDPPGREVQYLNGFVAELETRRGVMEFVELAAEARGVGRQPPPDDEFGYTALLGPRQSSAQPPIPLAAIADATARFDKFVLLGEPGAGKTTALRRLARAAARDRLGSDRFVGHPLPLLLYLPQWTNEPTPAAFVRARWQAYGLPPADPVELARLGEVALYLDGLNEMGADGPRKAGLLAGWLRSADGPKRAVVTCRARDYHGPLALGELPTVTVRELDEPQIRQFAANYLGERADAFLSRVLPPAEPYRRPDPRRMNALVTNPYLLGALVYLFEQSPQGELPANNGLLFRRLAQALWSREKQRYTPGWRPFEEVEGRFAALAFAMIDDGQPIDVPEVYAYEKLGDPALLQIGLSASFLQGNDGTVRFYHQLFQEYFAGVALLGRGDLERFIGKYELAIPHGLTGDAIGVTAHTWDEPVVAAGGIALDREVFASRVSGLNPYLALRGLAGFGQPSQAVAQAAAGWLELVAADTEVLKRESGEFRQKYHDGGSGMYDDLADLRNDQIAELTDLAGRLIGDVGDGAISPLADALQHRCKEVRAAAIEGLLILGYGNRVVSVRAALADWKVVRNERGRWAKHTEWFPGIPGASRGYRPVASHAARVLATHGPHENRDTLRRWVRTTLDNSKIWNGPTDALAFVGPTLLPAIYDVFAGGDDDTRITLAEAIGAVAFLHAPLASPHYLANDPSVAELAAVIVELFHARYSRDEAKAEWLVGLLTHPQICIRHHACTALSRVYSGGWPVDLDPKRRDGAARTAPALRAALGDSAHQVRSAASHGFMYFADLAPLDDLRRLADTDSDERVRKAAKDAVKRLTPTPKT